MQAVQCLMNLDADFTGTLEGKDEIPRFAFHYSPKLNRRSIGTKGLLKDPPSRGRMWNLQRAAVYMFANPVYAWQWQQHVKNMVSDPPDILRWTSKTDNGLEGDIWVIDTKGLNLENDEYISYALRSAEDIPTNNIQLLSHDMKMQLAVLRTYDIEKIEKLFAPWLKSLA